MLRPAAPCSVLRRPRGTGRERALVPEIVAGSPQCPGAAQPGAALELPRQVLTRSEGPVDTVTADATFPDTWLPSGSGFLALHKVHPFFPRAAGHGSHVLLCFSSYSSGLICFLLQCFLLRPVQDQHGALVSRPSSTFPVPSSWAHAGVFLLPRFLLAGKIPSPPRPHSPDPR